MDAKIFVYGFCLVAIIAGTSFWSYTMDLDEVQKEVINARQQLNDTEDALSKAKGWLAARKEATALISAASVIQAENDSINNDIKKIRQQRSEVVKNFTSTIERSRGEIVGTTLPEVALTTGARLKNAKIQSLDQEITVFQHSEGVSKVATNTLPSEIQDRLKFGYTPGGSGGVTRSSSATDTSVSDRIARMGADAAPQSEKKDQDKPAAPPASTPAPVEGQRESLGRIYIPGKGWQKSGASN